MKIGWITILVGVWAGPGLWAADQKHRAFALAGAENKVGLDELFSRLERDNMELRSLRQAVEAARARAGAAGVWPDIMVGVSREKPMGGGSIDKLRGEQEIPFPAKSLAERRTALAEIDVAAARLLAKTQALRSQLRTAYYRLWRAAQAQRRIAEQRSAVDAAVAVFRARTAAPLGGMESGSAAEDVFMLQAERGRLESRRSMEGQSRYSALLDLRALLNDGNVLGNNVDGSLEPGWVDEISAPALRTPPPTALLVERARVAGPIYRQALAEENVARQKWSRARWAFAPDITLMAERMRDNEKMSGSEVGLTAGLPLWWSRPRSEQREARAELSSMETASRAMALDLDRMVSTEASEVVARLVSVKMYETTILPAAQSALTLARRRYETKSGDVVRLLAVLRDQREAQMEYLDAVEQYALHWSALEQAVGVPLQEEKP